MKTWFRAVAILFVIFLGVGLLVALKSFSVPTVTTGEFILISGTNSLIIGGIILLSLTLLTTSTQITEVEKKKPTEEEYNLERAIRDGFSTTRPEDFEGKFAMNVGKVAYKLRQQKVKNLTVYEAFASAVSKVAQELRGYLKKKGLDNYILDRLSEKTPEAISYLFDEFSKLYGQMSYMSKQLGNKYKLGSVPKPLLKKFAYSLR